MAEQQNSEHLQILVLVVDFLELKAEIVHYALQRSFWKTFSLYVIHG